MAGERQTWLVKQNPKEYPIEALEEEGTTMWEGVRSYEARNNLRAMEKGDLVLYYHSSARPSGVAGIARVCTEPYPDPTQFDEGSGYYDEDSDPDDPTWWLVDLEHVETFPQLLPLPDLRKEEPLEEMVLLNRQRLSVQPVDPDEFEHIRSLGRSQA